MSRGTRVSCQEDRLLSYTGLSPSMAETFQILFTSQRFFDFPKAQPRFQTGPRNPRHATPVDFNTISGLGCSPFARRYLGNRCYFLFLGLLRCFNSPRSFLKDYIFIQEMMRYCRTGFSHSEISGLTLVCSYPKLIAAYHVLHNLSTPRHPPIALNNLSKNLLSCSNKQRRIPYWQYSIVKEQKKLWWR